MNIAELTDAICDRAAADTGSGGLFAASTPLITKFMYAQMLPANAMPYCVFFFAAEVAQDMFTRNQCEVQFTVSSFTRRDDPDNTDPARHLSLIKSRVYGDSSAAQIVPTFGFHRWKPTLSEWTATHIRYLGGSDETQNDDIFQYSQRFGMFVNR